MQIIKKTSDFITTTRLIIVAVAALALMVIGFVVQASSDSDGDYRRVVTIYDQGKKTSIVTKAKTVGRAIELAKIDLIKGDKVEPASETELTGDEFTINVYRARPILVIDGLKRDVVVSTHSNPRDIAKQANIDVRQEDKLEIIATNNVLVDGVAAHLNITRATPVELVLYGTPKTVYTHATTVSELLGQKGVNLAENDTLSIDASTKITSGLKIEIWRNGVQTITEDVDVPFTTKTVKDDTKEASYKQVQTAGKNGKKTVTYEVVMKNGQEVERREISSVVTEEPVEQVEVIGTKFNYTGGPLNEAQITALGQCESGMTATRNSGNGFYGAFQFMPSTWRSVAPAEYKSVLPHQAPLEAQKQAVQNLLSRSSIYTQFPACAKKMQAQGVI